MVANNILYGGDYGVREGFDWACEPLVLKNLFQDNVAGDYLDKSNDAYTGGVSINTNIPGATNNVDGDPLFGVTASGAWTETGVYSSSTFQTVLIAGVGSLTPGALAGQLLNPDTSQGLYFLVVDNTEETITVWGDAASLSNGTNYEVVDFHIPDLSPAAYTGSSLGFTTGGGWFYWPGSENPTTGYAGDRTNFGYTMKYNKNGGKVKGSILLIRHLPDDTIYRVKSNALEGLSIGTETDEDTGEEFGWASFSGKATYLEPDWPEPVGNHSFITYVEDRNEPGTGNDRVWIETRGKDGSVISVMSVPTPAPDNAETLGGGNIVAPH